VANLIFRSTFLKNFLDLSKWYQRSNESSIMGHDFEFGFDVLNSEYLRRKFNYSTFLPPVSTSKLIKTKFLLIWKLLQIDFLLVHDCRYLLELFQYSLKSCFRLKFWVKLRTICCVKQNLPRKKIACQVLRYRIKLTRSKGSKLWYTAVIKYRSIGRRSGKSPDYKECY